MNQYNLPSIVGEGCTRPVAAAHSQLKATIFRKGIRMEAVKITIAIG